MSSEPLIHNRNNPVTDAVDRVGIATGDGRPLTAVRKVLRGDGDVVVPHWTTADDPDHWNYWRREDFAYTSGIVDEFADDGLRGPHLLDRVERDDGSIELWLEDVRGRSGSSWEVVDHVRCFGRLGAAEGRLGDGAVPTDGWLSRRWLRSYSSSRPPGPGILDDDEAWEHPVVVEGFGPQRAAIRHGFRQLWADHDRWFGVVASMPQTLCHLDCWPRNLIAADDGTDVLVDWSFVGIGAVGEDPGNNVPDTLLDHFLEPDRFDELDDAVWTAYAGGLRSAGWPHPIDTARLGMVASGVAKYLWLPGLMVGNVDLATPTAYGGQDGYPLVEVFRRRAVVFEGLLRWADEARERCANLRP